MLTNLIAIYTSSHPIEHLHMLYVNGIIFRCIAKWLDIYVTRNDATWHHT